jgi:hypothetical protein
MLRLVSAASGDFPGVKGKPWGKRPVRRSRHLHPRELCEHRCSDPVILQRGRGAWTREVSTRGSNGSGRCEATGGCRRGARGRAGHGDRGRLSPVSPSSSGR